MTRVTNRVILELLFIHRFNSEYAILLNLLSPVYNWRTKTKERRQLCACYIPHRASRVAFSCHCWFYSFTRRTKSQFDAEPKNTIAFYTNEMSIVSSSQISLHVFCLTHSARTFLTNCDRQVFHPLLYSSLLSNGFLPRSLVWIRQRDLACLKWVLRVVGVNCGMIESSWFAFHRVSSFSFCHAAGLWYFDIFSIREVLISGMWSVHALRRISESNRLPRKSDKPLKVKIKIDFNVSSFVVRRHISLWACRQVFMEDSSLG